MDLGPGVALAATGVRGLEQATDVAGVWARVVPVRLGALRYVGNAAAGAKSCPHGGRPYSIVPPDLLIVPFAQDYALIYGRNVYIPLPPLLLTEC